MKTITRRKFLASTGLLAGGALALAGCAPAPTPVTSTPANSVYPTVSPTFPKRPTRTPYPTPAYNDYRRPAIVKRYPEGNSRVVKASDARAWSGDALSPQIVRNLVDGALTSLTKLTDVKEAWRAIFDPGEKIAIKVNAFRNSNIWTHPALVYAVTDSIVAAGIPAENITIFDYYSSELKTAGFTINRDGPGVRCFGTDDSYSNRLELAYSINGISDILMAADAVINMPVLKIHEFTGITFAMKNHYGSIKSPNLLHTFPSDLLALSALPAITNSTRLVIGDILGVCIKSGWYEELKSDTILMSFDPVATDKIAVDITKTLDETFKDDTNAVTKKPPRWLEGGQKAGLGAGEMEKIDLISVR